MREIRTLRSTWRGLETWHGISQTGAPVLDPTDERRLEMEPRQSGLRGRRESAADNPPDG